MTERAHVHRVRDLDELKGLVGKVVMYNAKYGSFTKNALYQGLTDEESQRNIFTSIRN